MDCATNITSLSQPSFRTMDIIEAAQFLGAHKETVRRLVAKREIPGVKVGRAWRFIEADLVNYMRNKYSMPDASQGAVHRSNKQWRFTKEVKLGRSASHIMDKEYKEALGLLAK